MPNWTAVWKKARALAARKGFHDQAAEDLASDVVLLLWERGPKHLNWALVDAIRAIYGREGFAKSEARQELLGAQSFEPWHEGASDRSPLDALLDRERLELLRARLTPKERELLEVLAEDRPGAEAGRIMGVSQPRVSKMLKNAREAERKPVKCRHKPRRLGYIAKAIWAEELIKKGIQQTQCPRCKLWLFPEEMNP